MPPHTHIPDEAVKAASEAGNHAHLDGADDATCWRLGLRAALPIVLNSRDEEYADLVAEVEQKDEELEEWRTGARRLPASRDSETAEPAWQVGDKAVWRGREVKVLAVNQVVIEDLGMALTRDADELEQHPAAASLRGER
jgi:hypothetical protein